MATARTLTLTEAFAGPQITVYGNLIPEFPLFDQHAGAQGGPTTQGQRRTARVLGVQLNGGSCTRLRLPIILSVFGDGEELAHPECGFVPGEVRKWRLNPGTQVVGLRASQGTVEEVLASESGLGDHGSCECEKGKGMTAAAVGAPGASVAAAVGACISVTINNGQACLNLPIVGSVCIPVPSWVPSGTAAQACIDMCTTLGIPCGVKVRLIVGGVTVASESWGCC